MVRTVGYLLKHDRDC